MVVIQIAVDNAEEEKKMFNAYSICKDCPRFPIVNGTVPLNILWSSKLEISDLKNQVQYRLEIEFKNSTLSGIWPDK